MASIAWLSEASNELDEIEHYIGLDDMLAAGCVIAHIIRAVDQLELFPRSGRVVPEYGRHDVRELIVEAYRIVYKVRDQDVEIAAVRHSASRLRDIPGV